MRVFVQEEYIVALTAEEPDMPVSGAQEAYRQVLLALA
jgi:hypothetical protein